MLSLSSISGAAISDTTHVDTAVYTASVTLALAAAQTESAVLTAIGSVTLGALLEAVASAGPVTVDGLVTLTLAAAESQAGYLVYNNSVTFSAATAFAPTSQLSIPLTLTLAVLEDFQARGYIPGPPAAAFRNRTLSLPAFTTQALSQPVFAAAAVALPAFANESLES